uniref:Uncharacterized protein n=1 Tax=Myotis myotis TaxID=51298 RepID=A0A7J7UD85_MYOMY|nr:hypothetical protein mMyoMyo1_008776 [Myotis myotis]
MKRLATWIWPDLEHSQGSSTRAVSVSPRELLAGDVKVRRFHPRCLLPVCQPLTGHHLLPRIRGVETLLGKDQSEGPPRGLTGSQLRLWRNSAPGVIGSTAEPRKPDPSGPGPLRFFQDKSLVKLVSQLYLPPLLLFGPEHLSSC